MEIVLPSLFFLLFYVALPVGIALFKGGGWARLYSFISSFLAAYWAYQAPLSFLESMVFQGSSPVDVSVWFKFILDLATEYGRLIFAAIVFILLYLFQYRLIYRLVEMIFGLSGE